MSAERTVNPAVTILSPEEAEKREAKARRTVLLHALVTVLAGLLPIPFLDLLVMSFIQVRMLKKVGEIYGYSFTGEQRRYELLGVLMGGVALPVLMVPVWGSLLKLLPVIGTFGGILAVMLSTGPLSYALGLTFIQHFESGGTLLSFEPGKMRQVLRAYYKQGRQPVQSGASSKASPLCGE